MNRPETTSDRWQLRFCKLRPAGRCCVLIKAAKHRSRMWNRGSTMPVLRMNAPCSLFGSQVLVICQSISFEASASVKEHRVNEENSTLLQKKTGLQPIASETAYIFYRDYYFWKLQFSFSSILVAYRSELDESKGTSDVTSLKCILAVFSYNVLIHYYMYMSRGVKLEAFFYPEQIFQRWKFIVHSFSTYGNRIF